MLTTVLLSCFFIGCVAGLRSLTAPAAVCWAAYVGWLHFTGTSLSFIFDHIPILGLFPLLALIELVTDKLPKTPARTAAPGLIARVVMGAFCGAALAVATGGGFLGGSIIGVLGALVGTFGGYHIRRALVTQAHLPDIAVALAEDLVAIGGAFYIVSHVKN